MQTAGAGRELKCVWVGNYHLVAEGRTGCATTQSSPAYLMYFGGNKKLCASTTTRLIHVAGKHHFPRSLWALDASSTNETTLLAVGRDCPGGVPALAGHVDASHAEVFLAPQHQAWRVVPLDGKCSVVNLIFKVSFGRHCKRCVPRHRYTFATVWVLTDVSV